MAGMRNNRGAGLLQSVGGVMLITAITIGAVLLIVNAGIAINYKQKIEYAAVESARYANGLDSDGSHHDVEAFADDLMRRLKVPYGRLSVDLKDSKIDGEPVTNCTIRCYSLGLIGNLFGLIDLEDTASVPKTEIVVAKTLRIYGKNKDYYVPVLEQKGKDSLGMFGSKGYLAVRTTNYETQPRVVRFVLPADYSKEAESNYGPDFFKPRDRGNLPAIGNTNFPQSQFNGTYYVELGGGGAILKP